LGRPSGDEGEAEGEASLALTVRPVCTETSSVDILRDGCCSGILVSWMKSRASTAAR
jgi:hypothetical protein